MNTQTINNKKPGKLKVDLGETRSYDIIIGTGLINDAARYIKPLLPRNRALIVTDSKVAKIHADNLLSALRAHHIECDTIIIAEGEQSKNFETLENLINRLISQDVERNDVIIAFGGGVIGDLTGFAAAILRRGIDFIQIPTTLLAQVDSSVGGKTAINTDHGKNLVGAFHQPRLVLADVAVLHTLEKRELLAGYTEIVKYALIRDADFFAWLEDHGKTVISGDKNALLHAVMKSCTHKAEIVKRDETEKGERALLNLGHTFGHALEAATGYGRRLLHGEAVAIGIVMAFALSAKLGHCSDMDVKRIEAHLKNIGLPTHPKDIEGGTPSKDELINYIKQDKKVTDGRVTFILANGIGQAFLTNKVEPGVISEFLAEFGNRS